jgi:aspartate carbamoyltransferase catalytic subunit
MSAPHSHVILFTPQEMLTSRGVDWQEVSDLREVASDVDVLYQTRIQKERFTNLDDYAKVRFGLGASYH